MQHVRHARRRVLQTWFAAVGSRNMLLAAGSRSQASIRVAALLDAQMSETRRASASVCIPYNAQFEVDTKHSNLTFVNSVAVHML